MIPRKPRRPSPMTRAAAAAPPTCRADPSAPPGIATREPSERCGPARPQGRRHPFAGVATAPRTVVRTVAPDQPPRPATSRTTVTPRLGPPTRIPRAAGQPLTRGPVRALICYHRTSRHPAFFTLRAPPRSSSVPFGLVVRARCSLPIGVHRAGGAAAVVTFVMARARPSPLHRPMPARWVSVPS